ncbi:MAG: hypothetical protein QXT47_06225 [Desulfurococcaceae archaeon]
MKTYSLLEENATNTMFIGRGGERQNSGRTFKFYFEAIFYA